MGSVAFRSPEHEHPGNHHYGRAMDLEALQGSGKMDVHDPRCRSPDCILELTSSEM